MQRSNHFQKKVFSLCRPPTNTPPSDLRPGRPHPAPHPLSSFSRLAHCVFASSASSRMHHLVLLFEVPEDKATAAAWFEKAAREGHAQAMKNLGKMYAAGDGVPQDEEKSDYWFKKAGMGELYVKGKRATNL